MPQEDSKSSLQVSIAHPLKVFWGGFINICFSHGELWIHFRLLSFFRCLCGNCQIMETELESVCCVELEKVMGVWKADEEISCITMHEGFGPICLNPYVLQVAYYGYRQNYGDMPERNQTRWTSAYNTYWQTLIAWLQPKHLPLIKYYTWGVQKYKTKHEMWKFIANNILTNKCLM